MLGIDPKIIHIVIAVGIAAIEAGYGACVQVSAGANGFQIVELPVYSHDKFIVPEKSSAINSKTKDLKIFSAFIEIGITPVFSLVPAFFYMLVTDVGFELV